MNEPSPQHAPAMAGPDLLAAAAGKAGLVWVSTGGRTAQALWHVWHEDAVCVVVGGGEQPDPFNGEWNALMTVPSKDSGAALLKATVTLDEVGPDDPRWGATTSALAAARLNAPDSATMRERWAETSRVLRLVAETDVTRVREESSGARPVDVERVRPRRWRPMRSRLRRRG